MNIFIVKTFELTCKNKFYDIQCILYITARHPLLPDTPVGSDSSQLVKLPTKSFIYIFNISKSSKLAREKDILSILNIGLIFHFFLIGIHGYIFDIMLNPNDKATSNIMIDFDLGQKNSKPILRFWCLL